jgi:hypothetical protein
VGHTETGGRALSGAGLLHDWLGQEIEQYAGGFVATSVVVIAFLLSLIEMTAEPKPLYVGLRNVWSAILLGVPGGVITTGVAKLVGW